MTIALSSTYAQQIYDHAVAFEDLDSDRLTKLSTVLSSAETDDILTVDPLLMHLIFQNDLPLIGVLVRSGAVFSQKEIDHAFDNAFDTQQAVTITGLLNEGLKISTKGLRYGLSQALTNLIIRPEAYIAILDSFPEVFNDDMVYEIIFNDLNTAVPLVNYSREAALTYTLPYSTNRIDNDWFYYRVCEEVRTGNLDIDYKSLSLVLDPPVAQMLMLDREYDILPSIKKKTVTTHANPQGINHV